MIYYLISKFNINKMVSLDRIVEATGARSVEYLKKYTCCGSAISGIDEDSQLKLLKDKLEQIERVGADCICVICPACYMQLDEIKRKSIKNLVLISKFLLYILPNYSL